MDFPTDVQPRPGGELVSRRRSPIVAQHPVRQRPCHFPGAAKTAPGTDRDRPRCPWPSPLEGQAVSDADDDVQSFEQASAWHPGRSVYIGRGSKWGNPFRIGVDGDRATVIAQHAAWLRDQHDLLRALDELRSKDLVCFCSPHACHGDVLLHPANASRDERVAWWRGLG
jgi:hypothetical protein